MTVAEVILMLQQFDQTSQAGIAFDGGLGRALIDDIYVEDGVVVLSGD